MNQSHTETRRHKAVANAGTISHEKYECFCNLFHYISYLADAFIQRDYPMDLIVWTPGLEPPTFQVPVTHLRH